MKFLPLALLMGLFVGVPLHQALCDTPPPDSLLEGELQLEGKILKIEKGRITIAASAFTNTTGKRGTIDPPKTKIILLPTPDSASNLKVGHEITVTGRDGGTGTPFTAREIALLSVPGAATPSPPLPPDKQPFLNYKEENPPVWNAGPLEVKVEKAGFDYPTRFLPTGASASEKTPVFYTIFRVRGAAPDASGRNLLTIRRFVGPHGEFAPALGIDFKKLPPDGDIARFAFWSSKVDPLWQSVDSDVDTVFGDTPAGKADTQLMVENVDLPTEGEATVGAEATSPFGTRYHALKIKRNDRHEWVLVLTHEQPAEPHDLEITGYRYQTQTSSSNSTGGGALTHTKDAVENEAEVFLAPAGETQIKRAVLTFHEEARSLQTRDGINRQRIRFPLRELLKSAPPAPLDKPLPLLAQTPQGPVTARLEENGLFTANDRAWGLLFLRGTPEDAKRGIRWTLQKGALQIPGQANTTPVSEAQGSYSYLWHVDATPKAADETVTFISAPTPAGATQGDMELHVEGRAIQETGFELKIDVPAEDDLIEARDDGEGTLILKKIQRFSTPEDLQNPPGWLRASWPHGGIALVFERSPLLSDADFAPYCLDAEDDKGARLRLGILSQNSLFQTDVTSQEKNAFYSLILEEPSTGAKSIKLWLSTIEKSHAVRQQTIQLKDIILDKTK